MKRQNVFGMALVAVFSGMGVFGAEKGNSSPPPRDAGALLKTLDPFYKQHVIADGLLIVGSEKVWRKLSLAWQRRLADDLLLSVQRLP